MNKKEIFDIGIKNNIEVNTTSKIIEKNTGLNKSQLFMITEIDDKHKSGIINDLKRLNDGEPLEYIINKAEFYSLNFYVDNRVLIPRNDTEVMVDKAIDKIIENDSNTLIDVGTGSSCIAISTFVNTSKINNCYVIDLSEDALIVSKHNIEKHGLTDKITQFNGDLLSPILHNTDLEINKNVIITANLPYIKNGDFENMDDSTIKHEPDIALYGGEKTGFELYEKLIKEAIQLKFINHIKNMTLFLEIGFDQKEYSSNYLTELGLKHQFFNDNSGIERCIRVEL